jgi:hypothetical protein
MDPICQGIVIGGAGGAIAGITLWIVSLIEKWITEICQKDRIFKWLRNNTTKDECFRSTRAIASWCNLTEDRVRYICSIDKRIFLSTGATEDMWSLYEREPRNYYDEHRLKSA